MQCRNARTRYSSSAAILTSCLLIATAQTKTIVAAEANDLSQGAPLQIEDTELAKPGEVELQLSLLHERTRQGENEFQFEPELQIGLTEKLQLEIAVPILAGSGDRAGSGNIAVRLLGKLWDDKDWLPSAALSGEVELPTGYQSDEVETSLRLLLTNEFGPEESQQRVHLNAEWIHHFDNRPGEREDRYELAVGYDHAFGKNTLVLGDVVLEQQPEFGQTYKLVEVGLRQSISSNAVVGVGVGTGLDSDSPRVRISTSLEISF